MLLLRKLSQKRHWDKTPWIEDGEVQADATKCLISCNNTMSVYVFEDRDGHLDRVVAALAARRDHIKHLDLAIVSSSVLDKCDIGSSEIPGETGDSQVNDWHKDLINLTFGRLSSLASCIRLEGNIRRHQRKDVERVIASSLSKKLITVESIGEKLYASLKSRGII